jgi:hypothetical protein
MEHEMRVRVAQCFELYTFLATKDLAHEKVLMPRWRGLHAFNIRIFGFDEEHLFDSVSVAVPQTFGGCASPGRYETLLEFKGEFADVPALGYADGNPRPYDAMDDVLAEILRLSAIRRHRRVL